MKKSPDALYQKVLSETLEQAVDGLGINSSKSCESCPIGGNPQKCNRVIQFEEPDWDDAVGEIGNMVYPLHICNYLVSQYQKSRGKK